jgi:hypothetical protein
VIAELHDCVVGVQFAIQEYDFRPILHDTNVTMPCHTILTQMEAKKMFSKKVTDSTLIKKPQYLSYHRYPITLLLYISQNTTASLPFIPQVSHNFTIIHTTKHNGLVTINTTGIP